MLQFQIKKKRNKILYSNWMILLLFLIGSVLVFRVIETIPKSSEVFKNKNNKSAEAVALKEKEARLLAQIEQLNTPEGVEADIREKFRLAKEGEGLIVIVDENSSEEAKEVSNIGIKSFFRRLFGN